MGTDALQAITSDFPLDTATQEVVIPLISEELIVLTMEKDTGGVRATKTVHESQQVVNPPLLREQVTVERKAIGQMLDVPALVRQEGDTLIIPVMEEVLVVKRHFLLKEEIHIHKVQSHVHEPQSFVVRREEVKVEQLPTADKFPAGK